MEYKHIPLLLFVAIVNSAFSQTNDRNYVKTVSFLNEQKTDSIVAIQYYDDLGRPNEMVTGGLNTTNKYLHTISEYDAYGRESRTWLPIIGGSTPEVLAENSIISFSSNTYNQDSYAYSEITYDGLNRPVFVTTPGSAWHERGKGKRTVYRSNTSGDGVKRYIFINPIKDSISVYMPNTLFCEERYDEDSVTTVTFKDMSGKLILERRKESETSNLDTYYIYDNKGQLRRVLQPMYQEEPNLDYFAFYYEYDSRGRVVKKKLPGCETEEMEYNNADQLCYSQDGELRNNGRYRFYLYDHLGRLVIQGTCGQEPTQLKATIFKAYYGGSGQHQFMDTGYRFGSTIPLGSSVIVETVNYYDDYSFADQFQNDLNSVSTLQTINSKGLLTGSIIKDSNEQARSLSSTSIRENSRLIVNAYDNESRLTQSITYAFERYAISERTTYNFCGDVTSTSQAYYRYNGSTMQWVNTATHANTYHAGTRKVKNSSGSLSMVGRGMLLDYTTLQYDNLGNLISNNRYGEGCDMAYSYNLLNGSLTGITSSGGFEQTLIREQNNENPRYNGSISAMTWKMSGESKNRSYQYFYDGVNRLLSAEYSEFASLPSGPSLTGELSSSTLELVPSVRDSLVIQGTAIDQPSETYNQPVAASIGNPFRPAMNAKYDEEIEYDKNSNITRLKRYGAKDNRTYGLIDNLDISYIGNQRELVLDSISNLSYTGSSEFVKAGSGTYSYNSNGALLSDENRGISSIEYDDLGNPKKIRIGESKSIEYVYGADGAKLMEIHKDYRLSSFPSLRTASVVYPGHPYDSDTTEYVGNLIFTNGHLNMLLFDGGYVSFDNDTISGVHYYIQDYMGNNRIVVNRDGTVEQMTHYYPYGGVIGDISTNESLQKYKFEGKELDRSFGLDTYDVHARQYFAMAPMWDRVDPLAGDYPDTSPYAYCGGDPVNRGDYDGQKVKYSDYVPAYLREEMSKEQMKSYLQENFEKALTYLESIGQGELLRTIKDDETFTVTIQMVDPKTQKEGNGYENSTVKNRNAKINEGIIWWDPTIAMSTNTGYIMSPVEGLYHEAAHAVDDLKDYGKNHENHSASAMRDNNNPYDSKEEYRVITYYEQKLARAMGKLGKGQVTRTNHKGQIFHVNGLISTGNN